MSRYDAVVQATANEYDLLITQNPLFAAFAEGKTTVDHYAAYLRETYHLVRHTSRALALAAARFSDDRRDVKNWFLEQANEENGHDLFCIKDLRILGYDTEVVLKGHPGPGAWGLVCQNYYMATYGNALGILGVASATEGLGATTAGSMAELLVAKLGIPKNATSFLTSHSGFDAKHLEEAKGAINAFIRDEDELAYVVQGRRMTYQYYGQLFCDVVGTPTALKRAA